MFVYKLTLINCNVKYGNIMHQLATSWSCLTAAVQGARDKHIATLQWATDRKWAQNVNILKLHAFVANPGSSIMWVKSPPKKNYLTDTTIAMRPSLVPGWKGCPINWTESIHKQTWCTPPPRTYTLCVQCVYIIHSCALTIYVVQFNLCV